MTSGPHLPQERKLVTSIPGPKSQELIKRRSEAVSAALGMAIPVVVEKAGGGVIIDVDGNSIIDMGAGIAVVNVGNSADRVVKNVQAQVEAFSTASAPELKSADFFLWVPGVKRLSASQTSI